MHLSRGDKEREDDLSVPSVAPLSEESHLGKALVLNHKCQGIFLGTFCFIFFVLASFCLTDLLLVCFVFLQRFFLFLEGWYFCFLFFCLFI